MAYAKRNFRTFELADGVSVECFSQGTRYGFRHVAVLYKNGWESARSKACYYNRTWESYAYQSVVHAVIGKAFSSLQAGVYMRAADAIGARESSGMLRNASFIAALAPLMAQTPKEANDWRKRFISKVPGIEFPADFDSLPEEEKQRRLDAAIAVGLDKGGTK
jgi:hypothetical protein